MNLWLRLLAMLAGLRARRPLGVLDTARLAMRVLPGDLDLNGHVNNGRYLTLADVGRIDFVLRNGSARVAWRLRARPVVGDVMAKFRRELRLFERFELETRMLGWNEKWVFVEHRFVRRGRVIGVVLLRGMFVAASGPVAPSCLVAALQIDHPSPPLPDWLSAWSASCDTLGLSLRSEEQAAAAR